MEDHATATDLAMRSALAHKVTLESFYDVLMYNKGMAGFHMQGIICRVDNFDKLCEMFTKFLRTRRI